MNYTQATEYIHSLLRFGIRPGLSRMDAVLSALGNPQEQLRCVHIAGTNGKGSVTTAVAASLCAAGYKTGLYTSPYVVDFLERVQVNGVPVDEALFARCVSLVKRASDSIGDDSVTEFEAITAAAFLCYAEQGCDAVALETGLGGRLDATNVIKSPVATVITSISLDHTAVLGDTLSKIAYEKCGIIKHGRPVIASPCQPYEALEVIKRTASERGCELIVPEISGVTTLKSDITGTQFVYNGNEFRVNMAGKHQINNMLCVIEACRVLNDNGFTVTQKNIEDGIASVRLPARVELLSHEPLVILDGGHNPDGVTALVNAVKPELCGRKLRVVLGMMADKDVENCVKSLCSIASEVVCVTPENPRAIKAGELAVMAGKYCSKVSVCEDASTAYKRYRDSQCADEVLLISGSLYLAGEIKRAQRAIEAGESV